MLLVVLRWSWMVCALCLAGASAGATLPRIPAGSALAVLQIKAGPGVTQDMVMLLTSTLTTKVRALGVFARVVGPQDIEDMLGLEQQRQLLNCNTTSCLAEMAGALGVDLVLSGDLGKLGSVYVMNLRLQDVRAAQVVASQGFKLPVQDDAALLGALDQALPHLLMQTPAQRRVTRELDVGPHARVPWLLGAGGFCAALGTVMVVLGMAGVAASTALLAVIQTSDFFVGKGWGLPLTLGMLGGWVAGGAVVVLGVLFLLVGGGVMVLGKVLLGGG